MLPQPFIRRDGEKNNTEKKKKILSFSAMISLLVSDVTIMRDIQPEFVGTKEQESLELSGDLIQDTATVCRWFASRCGQIFFTTIPLKIFLQQFLTKYFYDYLSQNLFTTIPVKIFLKQFLYGRSLGVAWVFFKVVNFSCFEVSQDNGSFISSFKYDDAHLSGS